MKKLIIILILLLTITSAGQLYNPIRSNEFVNKAFCQNKWLWGHMVVSGISTKLMKKYTDLNKWQIIGLHLAGNIVYEGLEYTIEGYKPYSSKKQWLYDTTGDIMGGMTITITVSL